MRNSDKSPYINHTDEKSTPVHKYYILTVKWELPKKSKKCLGVKFSRTIFSNPIRMEALGGGTVRKV